MKYFYKIIKIENSVEKTTIALNKKYVIIKNKYDKILKENKNIEFYKTYKNGKAIKHQLLLITNNPYTKGLGYTTSNGYKVLEIKNIYEERLFYSYPEKAYVRYNEVSSLEGYVFYIFLNKIIFEAEDKKNYLIVCTNKREASFFAQNILLSKKNIYLGILNKRMRSLYNENIIKKFDIKYETLYKPYIL